MPAIDLGYDVFAGGLHVMTSGMAMNLAGPRYDVRLDAELVGMPGWFANWWAVVQSGGRIDGGQLDPERHVVERVRRGETRLTELDFAADGTVAVTYTPERDDAGYPVPAEMLDGSLDPLSGIAQMMLAMTRGGGCDATVPVYDGRRRYDLVFSDLGVETLEPSGHAAFTGEARRCRMQLEPLAGDLDQDEEDGFWNRDSDPRRRQLDIWMARPVAGGPAVPVKMVGRARVGAVVVHLREARPSLDTDRSTADAVAPTFEAPACGAPC